MTDKISNDNGASPGQMTEPDSHGAAAMLLSESLLHGLIAREVITVADAIEIVEVATDVKAEIVADSANPGANLQKSLTLLGAVRDSLTNDLPITRA